MSRLRAQLPLLWLMVLAIGGCASLFPSPRPPLALRAAPFDVLGRVLVNFDGRALTANVRWRHTVESDDIWLMTPTGQALAYLREDDQGATFTGADQSTYRATSVAALTQRAMGWEFPTAQLQHWLRAAPAPGAAVENIEHGAEGRIKQLTQDGWRVRYDYYPADQYQGLPRRMELTRTSQTLRLVIDTWRDPAAETP